MNKLLSLIVAVAALSLCLGCATVSAIDTTCNLTTAIDKTVTQDLAGADYEATLAQLVADKGLCVVEAAVDEVIASRTPSTAKAEPDLVLQRALAWKSTHRSPKTAP